VITATSTRTEGDVVLVHADFKDEDGDANAFGFRGVKGAEWAEEQHDFAHPSYGKVTSTSIEYPFNARCTGDARDSSDVELWIVDAGGRRSSPVIVHLECARRTSAMIPGASKYLPMLLEKAQAPELDTISKYRATGTSTPLVFAAHATYERVIVELPQKPISYRFLIQRGSLTRLSDAQGNIARVPNLIDVNIDSKHSALDYARFALEISQGEAFWFADTIDQVPFFPTESKPHTPDAIATRKQVDDARTKLAPLVHAAVVTDEQQAFRVVIVAVHDRNLVEYQLVIDAKGKLDVTEKKLAADIPVVYVMP
jgi:hypothetical protein